MNLATSGVRHSGEVYSDSVQSFAAAVPGHRSAGSICSGDLTRKTGSIAQASLDGYFDAGDVTFEKDVLSEVTRLKREGNFRHAMGGAPGLAQPAWADMRSFFRRSLWYWSGLHGDSWVSVQPIEDPFNKVNSTWFSGLQLYASIFGVAVMELSVAEPPTEEIGHTWSWALSSACLAFILPTCLVLVPLSFIQAWTLSAVPRENYREVVCRHAFALGLAHRVGVFSFEVIIVAMGLRLYALYQFEEIAAKVVVAAYGVGVVVALLVAQPVLALYFEVMAPWKEAIKTVSDRPGPSGAPFYNHVDGFPDSLPL